MPEREYFTQSGRSAFKKILQLSELAKQGSILIPAYIGITDKEGSGVLDPLEERGVPYEFYAVDEQLAPVLDDLTAKLANPGVKAVLVIHYFGFCAHNFAEVVELCRAHGKLLIEDCAHALYSESQGKPPGSFGAASFFSLHKFLPVKSGGILRINAEAIAVPTAVADDIDPVALKVYQGVDLEEMRKTRRNNYTYLQSKLESIRPFFASLPDGVAPMNFPVWVEEVDRNELHRLLNEQGVRATTLYYRLVSEISEKLFSISYDISRHIMNLPIHQGMAHVDIDRMVETLRGILSTA